MYLATDEDLQRQRDQADAWCAAFVWKLTAGAPPPSTAGVVRGFATAPGQVDPTVRAEISRLAQAYRFFHWHLEFPEIFTVTGGQDPEAGPEGWRNGFSCLLGNPPWERVKLQEQEFFAARDPEIARAPNKAARHQLIKELLTSDSDAGRALHQAYLDAKRHAEGESTLLRATGRFPLTGRGDVNTYAVFAETFRTLTGPYGRSGVIVPTGIATDATTQYFFRDLVESRSLAALYDFENATPIFEGVHRNFKFSLLTLAGRGDPEPAAHFAFFLHDPAKIEAVSFSLTPEEITLGIYQRVPVLVKDDDPDVNPWGVTFMTMFHMSSDSDLFHTRAELEANGWYLDGNIFVYGKKRMLPLYEAKMLHHYDHRWATYDGAVIRDVTLDEKQDPRFVALPRYWVPEREVDQRLEGRWDRDWLLGWRNACRATDERTTIAFSFPKAGVGHSTPLILGKASALLLTILASLVSDYVARQKVGGTNFTFNYFEQLAVLTPAQIDVTLPWLGGPVRDWLQIRAVELSYTANDARPLAHAFREADFPDPPFRWNESRRTLLRAELDAALFLLYGIGRDDTAYILDTFPVVSRKDEAKYGEYRTKRLILDVYDRMTEAIRTGTPYRTILDPPPGQGPRHPPKQGHQPP